MDSILLYRIQVDSAWSKQTSHPKKKQETLTFTEDSPKDWVYEITMHICTLQRPKGNRHRGNDNAIEEHLLLRFLRRLLRWFLADQKPCQSQYHSVVQEE